MTGNRSESIIFFLEIFMEEIKVTNKEELENTVKEKQQNIVIVGEMAQIFIKSFEKNGN